MNVLTLRDDGEFETSPFFVNLNGNPVVEYIHQGAKKGAFVHYNDGKTKKYIDVIIGGKSIKKPAEIYGLVQSKVVTSPTGIITNFKGDIARRIHKFFKDHVVLPNEVDYIIATGYVILTWIYNGFASVPYLRIFGDYGTGKTTFLNIVSALSYRSMNLSGAVTTAPVFRIIKNVKGTFIIDEADFSKSDYDNFIVKILNSGYTRGFGVVRMNSRKVPENFDVFGCKVLSTREKFKDDALESRCLTITTKVLNASGLKQLHSKASQAEAEKIRNCLLFHRFTFDYDKIEADSEWAYSYLDIMGCDPRTRQILAPVILALRETCFVTSHDAIVEKVKAEFKSIRDQSPEGIIKSIIDDLLLDICNQEVLAISKIKKALPNDLQLLYSTQTINRVCSVLGYKRIRRSEGFYIITCKDKDNGC